MGRNVVILLAFLSLVTSTRVAHANSLAADLYFRGLPEVEATLPRSSLTMPSTAMPCVNCHGADGQGGREGGVAVPPISWRHLAIATTERPAYNQALFARALRDGVGADGTRLHDIMPRYTLSNAVAHELTDWLHAIEPARTRGVSDDEIVIAIPKATTDDPRAAVIASVLRLYTDRLNRNGGLYGRSLRLVEDDAEGAFAMLASLERQALSDDGPLDLWPLSARSGGTSSFPLIPTEGRLMQSLLAAARRDDPAARQLSDIADRRISLPPTFVFNGQAAMLSTFVRDWRGPAFLTIYTTPDHIDLAALSDLSPRPLKLVVANPIHPSETSDGPETAFQYAAFQETIDQLYLPESAEPVAKAAWVAAALLEDTLRRTGRALDQKRFKAALTSMPPFDSGLLPPVHPTLGLTSIGLVTFDLSTNEVTRLALALD